MIQTNILISQICSSFYIPFHPFFGVTMVILALEIISLLFTQSDTKSWNLFP